jgi:hypothetical protein
MRFLKWTQTGKGTHAGSLCQLNKGAAKIKYKPATMDGRTTHRTLSTKRTPRIIFFFFIMGECILYKMNQSHISYVIVRIWLI